MRFLPRLAAALLGSALLSGAASAQNLVTNPGFESGLTGWTAAAGWAGSALAPNSGTFHARKGPGGLFASLSQDIALARGRYTFSFFHRVDAGLGTISVTASIGGQQVLSDATAHPYQQFTTTHQQTSAGTATILFRAFTIGTSTFLDDVSLVFLAAIPPLASVLPPGTPSNVGGIAAALDAASGSTLFPQLDIMTAAELIAALKTLTGEAHTGGQLAAFTFGSQFLGAVLAGAAGGGASGGSAQPSQYASLAATETADQQRRFGAWVGPFGGYGWLGGVTSTGANGQQTSTQGLAAGLDYRFDHTVIGLAATGGSTNWYLEGGLGSGRSNVFQAALYGRTMFGPLYLAAVAAWGNHAVDVERTVPFAGDVLTAAYNATSWSGRAEAGHRFAFDRVGLTPFIAGQAQVLETPRFCERSRSGSGAALCVDARSTWSVRSELGLEGDVDLGAVLGSKARLTGRAAWGHEYERTGGMSAAFAALPGAFFVVAGAPMPSDVAILRLAAEFELDAAWSFRLQGDAEFGDRYGSLQGTARLAGRW